MGLGLFAVVAENWIIKGIRHCCCLLGLTTSSMVNLMDGSSHDCSNQWDVEGAGIGRGRGREFMLGLLDGMDRAGMLIDRPIPGVELGRV